MYCVKCGASNNDGSKFCRSCGAQLNSAPSNNYNLQDNNNQIQYNAVKPAGSKKRKVVIISIVAVLVIAAAVTAGLLWMNSGSKSAQKEVSQGQKYLADASYDQAISAFNKAIEIDPKNEAAYLGLADAYTSLGDNDKVVEALNTGVQNGVKGEKLFEKLAYVYISIGDNDAAVKALEDGIVKTGSDSLKQKLEALKGSDADVAAGASEAAGEPQVPGSGGESDTSSTATAGGLKWQIAPSVEADEIRAMYYARGNKISRVASIMKDGMYGIINYDGKIIVPVEYSSAPYFCFEGIVIDEQVFDEDGNPKGEHYGHGAGGEQYLWDMNNNKAAWFFGDAGDFEYLPNDLEEGSYVVEGITVNPTDNDYISFEDVVMSGKFGVINSKRELVVPLIYESIVDYSEKLAAAKKEGRWGYIDGKGNAVTPFIYEDTIVTDYYSSAYSFSSGFAAVKRDGKWGYINSDGKEVVSCTLEGAEPLYNGKGFAKQNGLWGIIELQ